MNIKDLVSISGMSGLYKLVGTRKNGIIVEDFDNGKRRFVPMRKHQFMPLEGIAIYTYTDSVPLKEVLEKMLALGEDDMPEAKADAQTLRAYFNTVLPEHDPDRVRTGDITKIIKWYHFLKAQNLLTAADEEE